MVDTPAEMFEHSLAETYYVENRLVDELDEMAAEADNDHLAEGFADHQAETLDHVARLESVFYALDLEPRERESLVFDALAEERERFAAETTVGALRDLYEMQAATKAERLEIASYEGLLTLADHLEYPDGVTDPLAESLSEERAALRRLEGLPEDSESVVEELLH